MRLLKYASKEWRKICRRFKWRSIVDKIKCFFAIKRPPTFSEFVGFELQRENDDRAEALTYSGDLKPLTNAFSQLSESTSKATTDLSTLHSIVKDFAERWKKSELSAFLWAANNHPEWFAVLNRTKKRRIKKKYRDRIMRAYLAELEEAQKNE